MRAPRAPAREENVNIRAVKGRVALPAAAGA
jgi:hypothetical protein